MTFWQKECRTRSIGALMQVGINTTIPIKKQSAKVEPSPIFIIIILLLLLSLHILR